MDAVDARFLLRFRRDWIRPIAVFTVLLLITGLARAQTSNDCGAMMVWDVDVAMCRPIAMANMAMDMLMIHGNAFAVADFEEGSRAQNRISAPNMLMADYGRSLDGRQELGLNLMLTFERWTFAKSGYPELLQIGEKDENGAPYVDSQHPHSSPVMGFTISDRIRFGSGRKNLKLFFAPRGQATEGPIAFMHRPTGMVNPDAPLGHHIGQDVAHISSTVAGFTVDLDKFVVEASVFNGTEPEPRNVDLPLAVPNSAAARFVFRPSPLTTMMVSTAYIRHPEPDDADVTWIARDSASLYNEMSISEAWTLHNAFIYGLVNNLDRVPSLSSFAEEFWLHGTAATSVWGRIEALQRTPLELAIPSSGDPFRPHWVSAVTLGSTRGLAQTGSVQWSGGVSVTKDFLPDELRAVYGADPWTLRIFLQSAGMRMWQL